MSAGRLPTFLIIGAQKAATTTVWAWLRAHPQVYCPPNKELAFFATAESFARGRESYAAAFADAGDAVAVGEASPQYTMFPRYDGVPERIAATVPDVRLIYVVRDPVERMRSSYRQALAGGSEGRPIDEALLVDARYLYPSLYALQLEQYLRVVDRSRVLVLASESLRPDPRPVLRRVCEFVGVSPDVDGVEPPPDRNVGADKRAPRRYWRKLGGTLLRHDLADKTPAVLRRMQRERHPMLTRPITDEETQLSPLVRTLLTEVLRPDMERFRELAGDDLGDADLRSWTGQGATS